MAASVSCLSPASVPRSPAEKMSAPPGHEPYSGPPVDRHVHNAGRLWIDAVKGPADCGCRMPLSPPIKACALWRRQGGPVDGARGKRFAAGRLLNARRRSRSRMAWMFSLIRCKTMNNSRNTRMAPRLSSPKTGTTRDEHEQAGRDAVVEPEPEEDQRPQRRPEGGQDVQGLDELWRDERGEAEVEQRRHEALAAPGAARLAARAAWSPARPPAGRCPAGRPDARARVSVVRLRVASAVGPGARPAGVRLRPRRRVAPWAAARRAASTAASGWP